jgi:hypothetical protein
MLVGDARVEYWRVVLAYGQPAPGAGARAVNT